MCAWPLLAVMLLSCGRCMPNVAQFSRGGSSMFKSNLQVATKDSQIETGRGLSDVLKSSAFPRPVYIVLKLLHGCMDAELVDMLRCSGRGAWKLIQEELAAFSMKDMKAAQAAHILNESTRQSNSHPDAMGTPWDTKKTWSHDMVPRNVSRGW